MTQKTNQNSITKCNFEKTLLKNAITILNETIDTVTSEDFDFDNPRNVAAVVVNLIRAQIAIDFALKCIEK